MHEARSAVSNVLLPASVKGDSRFFQRVSPLDDPEWDTKLTASSSASFFHSAAWARVLLDTYNFLPTYFIHGEGDGFHSLLPVMEVDSRFTGKRGISLPFTDECEPLSSEGDSFRGLFDEVLDYGRTRGWRYLELRGGKTLFGDVPASTSFLGHWLDLEKTEAVLWAQLSSSAKRAIKKAEHQRDLNIEFSNNLEAVHTFYDLLCQTRRRHGVPTQPFQFFEQIHRHVLARDRGQLVLARLG